MQPTGFQPPLNTMEEDKEQNKTDGSGKEVFDFVFLFFFVRKAGIDRWLWKMKEIETYNWW